MRHHSLTFGVARTTVDLTLEVLKFRYPDLKAYCQQVEWSEVDLEAWAQNPRDAQIVELITAFLFGLGMPEDQSSEAALESMVGPTEVDRQYLSARQVREVDLAAHTAEEFNVSDGPAIDTSSTASGAGKLIARKRAVEVLLSAMGQLEKLFVKLGLTTAEAVEKAHRKTETELRLGI